MCLSVICTRSLFEGSKLAAAGQSVVKVAGKDWQGMWGTMIRRSAQKERVMMTRTQYSWPRGLVALELPRALAAGRLEPH
jgi:hypothetical protein